MVVLISILTPSLSNAQEAARRTRCASNIRQIGLAVQSYAYENKNTIPPLLHETMPASGTATASRNPGRSENGMGEWTNDSMYARWASGSRSMATSPSGTYEGLGILVRREYLSHSGALYCPSHQGRHPYSAYVNQWKNGNGTIAVNYHYRTPPEFRYFSDMDSRTSFVADGMETRSDYSHVEGNNFLRADLAVLWYRDLEGKVLSTLPDDDEFAMSQGRRGWSIFDTVVERNVR